MYALLLKELSEFLSSLTGYIAVVIFLIITSLFLWVFPGNLNILDGGYATLEPLFTIAPWVFLFLIPALNMKSFSEEWRNGTLELIYTKPVTEWQIVLAKYIANNLVTIIALFPTLVYYYSIRRLSLDPGLDEGATWGSYIGIVFLALVFNAISLFASSLSRNQIVSFVIGLFISFFLFVGFEQISSFSLLGSFDYIFIQLGINSHYVSISRGVIDSRDLIYFLSLVGAFLIFTRYRLEVIK
ncbi:MAG TPA: gliding motility-associated ABC transporter permease subunit GldF [Flavobacteriales bacterium]|jgi:ABC-2 type transport system permease protein|nr:gliding motility-associated ABC transporter permease subunit GldF [Flavobacteriales bacterium]